MICMVDMGLKILNICFAAEMLLNKRAALIAMLSTCCLHSIQVQAQDWTHIEIVNPSNSYDRGGGDPWKFYKFNDNTGEKIFITEKIFGDPSDTYFNSLDFGKQYTKYDAATGKLHVSTREGYLYTYDEKTGKWKKGEKPPIKKMRELYYAKDYDADFFEIPNIKADSNGLVDVGIGKNSIKILTNGLATSDSKPLIQRKNGELHIGENSLITVEEIGRQKLYAHDADGNAIPIDIAEGSDLLVNGASVMGSIEENTESIETNRKNIDVNASKIEANRKNINDLGHGVAGATALTAALSSLPVASYDAPFSCGVGTGGYSSRFAMGLGCAARVNERLSLNVGGSHVFGDSSDYGGGSLGTIAARGGFVFKLGAIHKPSKLDGEELQSQLDAVKQENASIREENKELLARLERLEEIALGQDLSVTKVSFK